MAHFAEIDSNNIVIQVAVLADDATEETCQRIFNSDNRWIQTSYNTHGGVHTQGGTPLRKNYACIGYTYDEERDAFIPPRPFKSWLSWVLNEETCLWEAPYPMPDPLPDGTMNKSRVWNEEQRQWIILDSPTPKEIGINKTAIFDVENCRWIIKRI